MRGKRCPIQQGEHFPASTVDASTDAYSIFAGTHKRQSVCVRAVVISILVSLKCFIVCCVRCAHTPSLFLPETTYISGRLRVIFHRGPAEILAVNTCMKHLKPWQFIDLVSADTALLSESPARAHKHRSFWRQMHPEQIHPTHTPRQRREEWNLFPSLGLLRSLFSSPVSPALKCCCLPPFPERQTPSRSYLCVKLSIKPFLLCLCICFVCVFFSCNFIFHWTYSIKNT